MLPWILFTLAGGVAFGLASLVSMRQGPAARNRGSNASACAKASVIDELENIF